MLVIEISSSMHILLFACKLTPVKGFAVVQVLKLLHRVLFLIFLLVIFELVIVLFVFLSIC